MTAAAGGDCSHMQKSGPHLPSLLCCSRLRLQPRDEDGTQMLKSSVVDLAQLVNGACSQPRMFLPKQLTADDVVASEGN